MLILSRHLNEDIVIGSGKNAIIVKVVDLRPDRVRIGVTAPPSVSIMRRELIPPKPEQTNDGLERPDRKQSV